MISIFSEFRHFLSFPIEAIRWSRGESRGGTSVGQQYPFLNKSPSGNKKGTIQRRENDTPEVKVWLAHVSLPEIHFKRP